MTLPTAGQNYKTERLGISAVAEAIAHAGLIWRETPTGNVGIDGQIEYVDGQGRATGRIVGVQVKCGVSYFEDAGASWRFKPQEKHRFYWERYPVPVLLMLHHPENRQTYWVDVRQVLRSSTVDPQYVFVSKKQILQTTSPEALFAGFGVTGAEFLEIPQALQSLIMIECPNKSFPLSYFDLFANGLTNICRSLYFGMDLADTIAEAALAAQEAPAGLGIGPEEHEFLFGYTHFLTQQQIADINFADCLIDWYDRELQPSFLAPLTSRGHDLVREIGRWQDELERNGEIEVRAGLRVAQEGLVQMILAPSHIERIPIIWRFQNALRSKL